MNHSYPTEKTRGELLSKRNEPPSMENISLVGWFPYCHWIGRRGNRNRKQEHQYHQLQGFPLKIVPETNPMTIMFGHEQSPNPLKSPLLMAKIPMKFMAKIPIRNPDFIIPISMGPRAAGSSPLFATRWKRRPAMHGSPGAKIMAMAIWKSPASMELLNGKNHGNIMGEHPTGPGSLEPSRATVHSRCACAPGCSEQFNQSMGKTQP